MQYRSEGHGCDQRTVFKIVIIIMIIKKKQIEMLMILNPQANSMNPISNTDTKA